MMKNRSAAKYSGSQLIIGDYASLFKFPGGICLQILCGIVLKEEGLTLVTHYFNPFSQVSLVPLFFSFYLMYSIVSILSSECVLYKRRTVSSMLVELALDLEHRQHVKFCPPFGI
jgi:hypothetical protein